MVVTCHTEFSLSHVEVLIEYNDHGSCSWVCIFVCFGVCSSTISPDFLQEISGSVWYILVNVESSGVKLSFLRWRDGGPSKILEQEHDLNSEFPGYCLNHIPLLETSLRTYPHVYESHLL
jgi:hypothetical protein